MSETVNYDRTQIVNILRDLNVLVVSTDRIGSAFDNRKSDEEYNEMFVRFFDELGFFRKLAQARTVLSEPFSREVGDDGMDELEREFQNLKYWSESHS